MFKNIRYDLAVALPALVLAGVLGSSLLAHADTARTPLTRQMDIGSKGAQVTQLQLLLASNSTVYPAGLVTGYYGPMTADAVAQFQIAYGLPAVGRVGPATLAEINSLINSGVTTLDINAPFVSNVSVSTNGNSATITFNTNESATGVVHYDTAPISMDESLTSMVMPATSGVAINEGSPRVQHSITILGLVPNHTYLYAVGATDVTGNVSVVLPQSFTTTN